MPQACQRAVLEDCDNSVDWPALALEMLMMLRGVMLRACTNKGRYSWPRESMEFVYEDSSYSQLQGIQQACFSHKGMILRDIYIPPVFESLEQLESKFPV